jgi:ATP-binding cassette subfamily B protein
VLLGVLLLTGIGLQLANPQIARIFIDRAQTGEPFERLVWIALLFLGVVVVTQVATVAETYVAEDLGWRTTNTLRADLTRHVLELDADFHVEHTAGELIERIDGDVSAIADFFARFVVQVLGSSVFLVGVLGLLWIEDWRIGLLVTACVMGVVVFMARGGGFVAVRSRAALQTSAELSAYLEERLGGLVDLKSNGADEYVMHGLYGRLAARFTSVRSSVFAASIFNSTVGLVFALAAGGALALAAALYFGGAITLGSVYVVFRYTGMLSQPLQRLTRQMNHFQQATGGILRVTQILGIRPRLVDSGLRVLPEGALSIELDNVSFGYAHEPVLRRVQTSLAPGEVLGVLGRTGSGKTTISRLLFRLHDPLEGAVRLGGIDLRDVPLAELRSRIGLVTQDVQLFQGTLRDNVTLFDGSLPDERLRVVFDELALGDWLGTLHDGLGTVLGAGGRGLSAGEAQMVALARVFLKSPGLVILDEASSRLDPVTEHLLETAIARLLAGRSGVIIAHRLATVQQADRIMILENGHVVESGPRVELLEDSRSRFARLMRAGLDEVLA